MNYVCFNGKIVSADRTLFGAQNRSFKYGDGVFETIKVCNRRIPLAELHFERLFLSLKLLKIVASFNSAQLSEEIIGLCEKNNCPELARVRLAVYRNEDHSAGYVMEALPLSSEINLLNKSGYTIDIYPYARKSKDAFANLKTANFLPYVLAGIHAQENQLDDCIVLNSDNDICDTSKANIFLVKDKEIFTPALHQGCVNGVMRRFLIDGLKRLDFTIYQQTIQEEDLFHAEELFLTNAVFGMRWVKSFREKKFTDTITAEIYRQLVSPICRIS
jgi:branched-chain amino acid aminotransferase